MQTKVEIKSFLRIKECEKYVNTILKEKDVVRSEITPMETEAKRVEFFLVVEYRETEI